VTAPHGTPGEGPGTPVVQEPYSRAPSAPASASPKERRWRRLLPAVALFLLIPAIPQMRALVPIEQTLILLVPALAVCSWVAWRHGGSILFALGWSGLAFWVLSRPMAGGPSYVAFARGWALMLATAFGAVALYRPMRPFFGRAMLALAVSGAAFVLVLGFAGTSARQVERVIAGELGDRVESSVAAMRARAGTPEWQELQRTNPDAARSWDQLMDTGEAQLREIAPFGASVFPALLAFESLAALGLAWSLHHRLSRARLGPALAPLREFRFDDQMIWGVIGGLVFVLLPRLAAWKSVGWSLLLFLGALYALRGLGVMTWFLVFPGRWFGVVLVAIAAIIPPLWSFPLGIGLGDTYFDWRRRVRPSNQGSSQ
jgi:hypothetical protein